MPIHALAPRNRIARRLAHHRAWRLLIALALAVPLVASAQDTGLEERLPSQPLPQSVVRQHVYRMNHHLLLQGMRDEVLEHRKAARQEAVLKRRKKSTRPRGAAPLPAPAEQQANASVLRRLSPAAPASILALPANVRANNPSGDAADYAQSELALGAIGDEIMTSWNDGKGFNFIDDLLGIALSSNGGATMSDVGSPPAVAGYAQSWFTGDPAIATDEKNERFYVASLGGLDRNQARPSPADSSALLVARRFRLSGVWQWQTTTIVRALNSSTSLIDKEWIAADSVSGNVYVIYTQYDMLHNTSSIQFQSSADAGASFRTAITLSSATDAGDIQGARVATGPNGQVHVVWIHNNAATGKYDIRYRRSTNSGASFSAEVTVTSFVPHAATGPPGFNRTKGVDFPTLAVDRTSGAFRGRIYVGFAETYNYLDDLWTSQPAASTVRFETENNNYFNRANTFTAGQTLHGSVASDIADCWKVSLTAGQHLLVWFDSTGTTAASEVWFRTMAPDTTERIAYSIAGVASDLSLMPLIYTIYAPVTGTYYLRLSQRAGTSTDYRIRTKLGSTTGGPGRDRHDPFVSWSASGAIWSTPVRVNDSAVGPDDFLPEVTVGPDGYVYAAWYDARDDADMISTHLYTSRSGDGGATWLPNQRISTVATDFNVALSNLAPNMGDYLGMCAGPRRVHVAWGDGRGGSVDAYTESFLVDAAFTACPANTTLPVLGSTDLSATFQNEHAYASESFGYSWTDEQGWLTPQSGSITLAPGQSQAFSAHLSVTASATQGMTDKACLTVTNATGAIVRTCCATITVDGSLLAVDEHGLDFGLAPVHPNPVRGRVSLRFSLPHAGRTSLAIYDITGARVRSLSDQDRQAGAHEQFWDGHDESGRSVPPGIYFSRLEQAGRQAERRIVMLR